MSQCGDNDPIDLWVGMYMDPIDLCTDVCEMLSQEQECLNDLEKRQLFTEEFQSAVGVRGHIVSTLLTVIHTGHCGDQGEVCSPSVITREGKRLFISLQYTSLINRARIIEEYILPFDVLFVGLLFID